MIADTKRFAHVQACSLIQHVMCRCRTVGHDGDIVTVPF